MMSTLNENKPSSSDSDDSSGFIIKDEEVRIYRSGALVSEDDRLDLFLSILDSLDEKLKPSKGPDD